MGGSEERIKSGQANQHVEVEMVMMRVVVVVVVAGGEMLLWVSKLQGSLVVLDAHVYGHAHVRGCVDKNILLNIVYKTKYSTSI